MLRGATQTEGNHLRTAVVNGVVQVRIILRGPIQDRLATDRLCVLDVGIGTRDRYVEAAVALVLDDHNDNLQVSLFRLFGVGSVALFVFTRELKNASGYHVAFAISSHSYGNLGA